jgi:nitroreductase/NAD-dependent dihydropyrimidine dehydrogenase PreA subunit
MSVISVNTEVCKRDGICVAVCPMQIIEMKTKESFPESVEGAAELCINCGHCVAACPHEAMSQRTMESSDCPPVQKNLLLNPEQVEHFLRYRRSIRVYRDKPVEKDTITKMIEIARHAPSGHNLQPVHWLVINDAAEVRELAGIAVDWMRVVIDTQPELAAFLHVDRVIDAWERGEDRVMRGAPHLIVAHADKSLGVSQTACTIALTYLELTAAPFGLGACWAGYFNAAATYYEPMQKAIALPQGHACFGAMMIGYAKYAYHRLPTRNEPPITWRQPR